MASVLMIECDRQGCKKVERSEDDKSEAPPYGWLELSMLWFGSGPELQRVFCSMRCGGIYLRSEQAKNDLEVAQREDRGIQ